MLLYPNMHLADRLLHLLNSIDPVWNYALILLSALGEGLPFVGVFSPGGIFGILGGLLVKTGTLSLPITFIVAVIGAVFGDSIGYLVGHHYGYDFLKKYGKYFFLKEEHRIEKTRTLVKEHSGKAIILGRFYYISRSISPFLCGASEINFGLFLFYDILGALLWASVHLAIGYVFGIGFEAASHYINYILLVGILLSISMVYIYSLINRHKNVFRKYHSYTLIINIISIFALVVTLAGLTGHRWFFRLDVHFYNYLQHFITPAGVTLMTMVTSIGGFYGATLIGLIVLFLLLRKRHWYYSALFFFSLASGLISEFFLKYLTRVQRPPHAYVPTEFLSFPSGHATIITLLGVLIFHCFIRDWNSRLEKVLLGILDIFILLLVCFSRLYLNAHWLSDVVGGIALGVFWVTFYILILRGIMMTEKKGLELIRDILRKVFSFGHVSE